MSHMIEAADTVYVPAFNGKGVDWSKTWHGLETVLPEKIALDGSNIPNVLHEIIAIGVKLDMPEGSNLTPAQKTELTKAMKDWKVVCADLRQLDKSGTIIPVHIPKDGYNIHQNRKAFDCMVKSAQSVLGDNNFEVVTASTFDNYSQFSVSIAIKNQKEFDMGKGDVWNKFFNLNTSHNGLLASNIMLSLIRVVCMNTLQASISDATASGKITSIKHTKNSEDQMTPERFAKELELWIKTSDSFQKNLAILKEQALPLDVFKSFAAGIFTNSGTDELSTNSFNRIDDLAGLFSKGMGNVGETRYDALNAFTQYFTSGEGTGSDKVSRAKRIANANFGKAADWKLQAMDSLLNNKRAQDDPMSFAGCVKRGQVLLKDKLAVMVSELTEN